MIKRIKILYVITKSNWGGAQKYVYELAAHMNKDHEVVVAFGGTGERGAEAGALEKRLNEAGIRSVMISSLSRDIHLLDEPRGVFDLIKLYREEEPDIIHLNSSKIGGTGSLAGRVYSLLNPKRSIRNPIIIFTVHGWPFNENRPWIAKKIISFLSWLTVIFSHRTICINQKDLSLVTNWPFIKNKLELIYIGISAQEKKGLIKVGERPEGIPIQIGTISELTKNKGLTYAIDAISKIKDRNIMFSVIGEGEERTSLEKQIKEEGIEDKVKLLGFKDNAASYIGIFDIFMLSSVKEGLPYSILEAGLARLPVIATNVGGIPEIIEDGVSGILVPPKDSDAIKGALKKLLDNPELGKTLGKNLEKVVKQKFSTDEMTEKTEKLYGETIRPYFPEIGSPINKGLV
ncbi:MAG: glycosyltransferase family 4 protein [Candidatus Vogelbacteria bacterium]|nr:glycosyltransferase family 4 protein [Candidatus Vogelbacteria bacterium]